jgi:protein ImuA
VNHAFPNASFPLGALHEFFCSNEEEASASCGFIGGLLSCLMKKGGISVWVHSFQNIFPPALRLFGIDPGKMIFIHQRSEKEKLWVMEEALKCDGLSSVIGEINEISFTESRRFQLAMEQSKVTGFLIRRRPKNLTTACVTRWKISPLPTEQDAELPGLSFPRWKAELLKVRNGQPGSWTMEWREGKFRQVQHTATIIKEFRRKIV